MRATICRAPPSSTLLSPPSFRMFCLILGSTFGFHTPSRVLSSSALPKDVGLTSRGAHPHHPCVPVYMTDGTILHSNDIRGQSASPNQIAHHPNTMNHCTKAQIASPLISHPSSLRYTIPFSTSSRPPLSDNWRPDYTFCLPCFLVTAIVYSISLASWAGQACLMIPW